MSDEIKALEEKAAELQKELRKAKRDTFRAKARERRSEAQKKLTPVEAAADENISRQMAVVFSSVDGKAVLAYLESVRPLVADDINERIAKVAPANANPGP